MVVPKDASLLHCGSCQESVCAHQCWGQGRMHATALSFHLLLVLLLFAASNQMTTISPRHPRCPPFPSSSGFDLREGGLADERCCAKVRVLWSFGFNRGGQGIFWCKVQQWRHQRRQLRSIGSTSGFCLRGSSMSLYIQHLRARFLKDFIQSKRSSSD